MNLHIVKLKCTIIAPNNQGEEVAKQTSSALAIYNAGTFGNAEIETAKYFGQKASPENAHSVVSISKMNIHSVMYAITPIVAEENDIEALWFKIKVELAGDGKPFSNVYLVLAETMQKAQEFVKNSFRESILEVVFKTCSVIALMDYIELEGESDKEEDVKDESETVERIFAEEETEDF